MAADELAPPRVVPSPPFRLVIEAECPAADPNRVWAWWTQPPLLTRWWPEVAEVDLRPGGRYHLSWLERKWDLRGEYRTVDEPHRLVFTWTWDHDPGTRMSVDVGFGEQAPGGTRLEVQHGPYTSSSEDQELRESHREGWLHFLTRLQQALAAEPLKPASTGSV